MSGAGYQICLCDCANCGRPMIANTKHCPSVRLKNGRPDPSGLREPICKTCFSLWNKIHRTDKGLEPVPLHPQAYSYTDLSEEQREVER